MNNTRLKEIGRTEEEPKRQQKSQHFKQKCAKKNLVVTTFESGMANDWRMSRFENAQS